jgi:hypothetical protein
MVMGMRDVTFPLPGRQRPFNPHRTGKRRRVPNAQPKKPQRGASSDARSTSGP